MSQEKRNSKPFLKEFSELLVRKVNEAIQSEEFMADVYGINQRMVEHCGRILDELAIVIGARFTTKEFVSEETETGTSGRPSV